MDYEEYITELLHDFVNLKIKKKKIKNKKKKNKKNRVRFVIEFSDVPFVQLGTEEGQRVVADYLSTIR